MMAHGQEPELLKRKRSPDDMGSQPGHPDRIPQPPPPPSGATPINYLSKACPEKLALIQGSADTFHDVVSLLDQYEGVLNRHESLAANMGAKLTGPRLLKVMEGAFDGPIKVTPTNDCHLGSQPPSWLDIVNSAKSSPADFILTTNPDQSRSCQFYLKGHQVEIAEDDWRMIMSGAVDRIIPAAPNHCEEDENTELVTIEILEKRVQYLIKKADEVARKSRKLLYHVSGRKAGIMARISGSQSAANPGFQAVNQPQRGGPNPGYDLKADLLQQFLTPPPYSQQQASSMRGQPISIPATPTMQSAGNTPSMKPMNPAQFISRSSPVFGEPPQQTPVPQVAQGLQGLQGLPGPQVDDPSASHRPLITARIEKLVRGDSIHPPCDRCRRLKVQCIKHLTACQGCTKKHAKCGWKSVTDDELAWIIGQSTAGGPPPGAAPGTGRAGDHDADQPMPGPMTGAEQQTTLMTESSARASDISHLLKQDNCPEGHSAPPVTETNGNNEAGLGIGGMSGQSEIRDHSHLSHVASVATAAAEAHAAESSSHMQR